MFTYDVYLRMILRPTFTPVLSPPFEPGYHETVRAVFAAEKSKEGAPLRFLRRGSSSSGVLWWDIGLMMVNNNG